MLSLIGCSGTGKSLAVEEVLKFYPQVIRHSNLPEIGTFDQVVHLKVECPPNGSVKSLCKDTIDELDRVTGLNYARIYRTDRATESDLKKAVAQTFALHRVGLLVIDEIQNLTASRKNKDELFNFIVSLSNALDVPVLNVGTPQVKELVTSTMRVARRFGLWGKYDWGTLDTRSEWGDFFDKVKLLYALKDPYDEDAVKEALYYHSQGVPGILVNLFLLSQMSAMVARKESLTPEFIDRTDALYFSQLHGMVKALRENDKNALAKYGDMGFTDDDFQLAGTKLTTEIEIDSLANSSKPVAQDGKNPIGDGSEGNTNPSNSKSSSVDLPEATSNEVDPTKARNKEVDPIKARNKEVDPIKARNKEVDPPKTGNRDDDNQPKPMNKDAGVSKPKPMTNRKDAGSKARSMKSSVEDDGVSKSRNKDADPSKAANSKTTYKYGDLQKAGNAKGNGNAKTKGRQKENSNKVDGASKARNKDAGSLKAANKEARVPKSRNTKRSGNAKGDQKGSGSSKNPELQLLLTTIPEARPCTRA